MVMREEHGVKICTAITRGFSYLEQSFEILKNENFEKWKFWKNWKNENFEKIWKMKILKKKITYPTSNAKSLACDTANEHALERHAAAVRQLSNGTNGDDLYICIATVGNTIQTVNSPMYDT